VTTRRGSWVPHPSDGNTRIWRIVNVIAPDHRLSGQSAPDTHCSIKPGPTLTNRGIFYDIPRGYLFGSGFVPRLAVHLPVLPLSDHDAVTGYIFKMTVRNPAFGRTGSQPQTRTSHLSDGATFKTDSLNPLSIDGCWNDRPSISIRRTVVKMTGLNTIVSQIRYVPATMGERHSLKGQMTDRILTISAKSHQIFQNWNHYIHFRRILVFLKNED